MKKILIGADHAGFELKNKIVQFLKSQNYSVEDFGTNDATSVDFPDYANKVCSALKSDDKNTVGILICGSGQGMAMRANKFAHVRAALVYNDEITKLAREHNDANVLCIGSRFCTAEQAQNWVKIFLTTEFSSGRHSLRVAKIGESPSYC